MSSRRYEDNAAATSSNRHQQHRATTTRYASRWDDLPKNTSDNNNNNSKPATVIRSRFHSNNLVTGNSNPPDHQQKSHVTLPQLPWERQGQSSLPVNQRWKTANISTTGTTRSSATDDLLIRYRSLQCNCCSSLEKRDDETRRHPSVLVTNINDLLQFILQRGVSSLPAEETSTVVVHDILLPTLLLVFSELEQERRIITTTVSMEQIMKVLETLLSNKQHASAMLSPIISDRDVIVVANPTRRKLWSVLQSCLPITVDCFTMCIQMTMRSDESSKTNGKGRQKRNSSVNNDICLDVPKIISFLNNALSNQPSVKIGTNDTDTNMVFKRQKDGLKLLLSLLQYKPTNQMITSSVSTIQSLLFPRYSSYQHQEQEQHTVVDCSYCGWRNDATRATYLQVLHGHPKLQSIAIQSATILLQTMPLTLWLNGNRNSKPKKWSTFQLTLKDIVKDLIQVAFCKLRQQLLCTMEQGVILDTNATAALAGYIKSILTHVPFDDSDPLLGGNVNAGYELVAYNIVDTILTHPLLSLQNAYVPTIRDCLRGHITSSGPLQTTSIPINKWLRRNGRSFVQNILVEAMQKFPTLSVLSLLYDILRSNPDLLLMYPCHSPANIREQPKANTSLWSLFQQFLTQYSSTEPNVVAQCIERFLFGRQSYLKESLVVKSTEAISFDEMIDFMVPIFESYIDDDNLSDHIQGLVSTSFSYLTTEDWNTTSQRSSGSHQTLLDRMLIVIQRILENCTDMNKSEALQATSCKAIGDICTNFLPSNVVQENRTHMVSKLLIVKFFLSLKRAISNEYMKSVRCMAMFAIGNLSHTMTVTSPPMLNIFGDEEIGMFVDTTEICLRCMSDPNEKFGTNSVRTTGFMAGLVLWYQDRQGSTYRESVVQQLLQRVVSTYVEIVRSSVALDSSFELYQESQYSWKDRMKMKKQGWGSCNSLSFLLERDVLSQLQHRTSNDTTTEHVFVDDVVACLVECFENINTLHEKVVISACIAIRSIPDLAIVQNDQLLGRAIVSCCVFLFGDESIQPHLQQKKQLYTEMELVLSTLFQGCTVSILLEALLPETFTSNVQYLFTWMTQKSFSPIIFQLFATALNFSGSAVDFHVEQQFINHSRRTVQSDLVEEL